MKGIDVSHYQQGLDMARLREGGYEFAILKITEGSYLFDSTAPGFYMAAKSAGIPTGGYCYSRATTPDGAREEAAFLLSHLGGFPMPLGLYLDVEEPEQLRLSHEELKEIVLAWCGAIREAGYIPGVYGSEYNLWAKLRLDELPEDVLVWVAHYGRAPDMACDLWQSSDSGSVPGYSGAVDTDEAMSDRFERLVKLGFATDNHVGSNDQCTEDACPICKPDPAIMVMQMALSYAKRWGDLDGYNSPEFIAALREYADNLEKENAAKKYQQEKGLGVDGEVGSQTWASLITT